MTPTLACSNSKMADTRSSRSDFSSEGDRAEMRRHLKLIAGLSLEDNRKAALRFASRVLGMPYDRVRRLFYGEARRVEAHEADQIRAYIEAAHKLIEARAEYETLRAQYIATAHPRLARFAPPAPDGAEIQQDRAAPVKRARR